MTRTAMALTNKASRPFTTRIPEFRRTMRLFLSLALPLAVLAVDGIHSGFYNSCRNLTLLRRDPEHDYRPNGLGPQENILVATCDAGDGRTIRSKLNLDRCIGREGDHNMVAEDNGGAFAKGECQSCYIRDDDGLKGEKVIVSAPNMLCYCGNPLKLNDHPFDLNGTVSNDGGLLRCFDHTGRVFNE
ncbi:hypothetical protein BDV28DRAFT_147194 [Aspergillus coremiiformis]|uniref:Cyanovirin-N domain-containing protein n=1 Tax=Aspergillus coremiiformis TaxID=138285 RepID=A0A5N6Z9L6_9EURO|nr:hypothetical protein BDV28DRAFT_147194 [Aspergillus coremiiformis]